MDGDDAGHAMSPLISGDRNMKERVAHHAISTEHFATTLETGFPEDVLKRAHPRRLLEKHRDGLSQPRLGLSGRVSATGDIKLRVESNVGCPLFPDLCIERNSSSVFLA